MESNLDLILSGWALLGAILFVGFLVYLYAGELLTVEPEVHDIPAGGWISGGG